MTWRLLVLATWFQPEGEGGGGGHPICSAFCLCEIVWIWRRKTKTLFFKMNKFFFVVFFFWLRNRPEPQRGCCWKGVQNVPWRKSPACFSVCLEAEQDIGAVERNVTTLALPHSKCRDFFFPFCDGKKKQLLCLDAPLLPHFCGFWTERRCKKSKTDFCVSIVLCPWVFFLAFGFFSVTRLVFLYKGL